MSKDIDLKDYFPTLENIPGTIKAIEVYFDILKDLYKKEVIGQTMFFVLLSAYINEWKEKIINMEADKVKKIFNEELKKR